MSPVGAAVLGLFNMQLKVGGATALCAVAGQTTVAMLAWDYASPAALFLVWGCAWLLSRAWFGWSPWRFARARAELALFTYSTVAFTTLNLLHCVRVEGFDSLLLFRSAVVQCYTAWQGCLFVLLALLCCVPGLVLALLRRQRERIASVLSQANSHTRHPVLSLLTVPFTAHASWWSGVLLAQVLLFNAVGVLVRDDAQRALLLAALALAALLLHLLVRPFAEPRVQHLQTTSLVCWCVLALLNVTAATAASLAASAPQKRGLPPALSAWMAAVMSAPFVAWVALLAMTWWYRSPLSQPAAVAATAYVELADSEGL